MSADRLLLAEDDADVRETTTLLLQRYGWQVEAVGDGGAAVAAARARPPEAAVIDIAMPVLDGLQVTAQLRMLGIPVILLTARDSRDDMIHGLDAGADDYVAKPFDGPVLAARVRAVLRRPGAAQHLDHLGAITVDRAAATVTQFGRPLPITATELRLLELLLDFKGNVLTREQILEYVWPALHHADSRVVDTYVQRLRKKLNTTQIVTVRGLGYRLDPDRP